VFSIKGVADGKVQEEGGDDGVWSGGYQDLSCRVSIPRMNCCAHFGYLMTEQ
jgi:hypothetical protein